LRKAIPAYARRVEAGFSEKEKEDDKLRGLVVLIGDLSQFLKVLSSRPDLHKELLITLSRSSRFAFN
jgi:hypothetical protein